MELKDLRKVSSNPERYLLNVDGKDVKFTFYELFNYPKFKHVVAKKLDFMPDDKDPREWEGELRVLLQGVKHIPDSSH